MQEAVHNDAVEWMRLTQAEGPCVSDFEPPGKSFSRIGDVFGVLCRHPGSRCPRTGVRGFQGHIRVQHPAEVRHVIVTPERCHLVVGERALPKPINGRTLEESSGSGHYFHRTVETGQRSQRAGMPGMLRATDADLAHVKMLGAY